MVFVMKMSMWYGYNPYIKLSLFQRFELFHFSAFLLSFFQLQYYQTVYIIGTFRRVFFGKGIKFSERACPVSQVSFPFPLVLSIYLFPLSTTGVDVSLNKNSNLNQLSYG